MAFEKRKPKWRWRDFLTADELVILQRADDAKLRWAELNRERALITNRAIQRAKYAANAHPVDAARPQEG